VSTVFTEDRGPVRHGVLNRPEKRNAMNHELLRELGETLHTAATDNDVRDHSRRAGASSPV
jgi:enoyl-CoA hydratase/carnithine racemase